MTKFNGRGMKALLILSIIVPVGLLATLRLTGMLQGPKTIAETITLESVKWEFQRPNRYTYIDQKLQATYTGDTISSTFYVGIGTYDENSVAYEGADLITMALRMNSTMINQRGGYIESVSVVLRKDSQQSKMDWLLTYMGFKNLSLTDIAHGWESDSDAYVRLAGVNQTRQVYFSAATQWSLLTQNDQTHQMELIYELTYYNGTAYKKVVQPFQLNVTGS